MNSAMFGPYLLKQEGSDTALYFKGRCMVRGFRAIQIAEALEDEEDYPSRIVPGFYKTFPSKTWEDKLEASAAFGCEHEFGGEEVYLDQKGRKRLRTIWKPRPSYLDDPGQWSERLPATHCNEITERAYRSVIHPDIIIPRLNLSEG